MPTYSTKHKEENLEKGKGRKGEQNTREKQAMGGG